LSLVIPKESGLASDPPNGVITYNASKRGPTRIPDGETNTIVVAETREPNYAAWFDGTTAWGVAHDPNSTEPIQDKSGRWVCQGTCRASLNVGPNMSEGGDAETINYRAKWEGGSPWQYGPSSTHDGGMVQHLFGGKAVKAFQAIGPTAIDPTVYMALVTRAGGESDKAPE
jgi:hypothetical protein